MRSWRSAGFRSIWPNRFAEELRRLSLARRIAHAMISVGPLWRTVRHLKLRQVVGRIRFRMSRPKVVADPAPSCRALPGRWVLPARRASILSAPASLRLLNTLYDVDASGWDDPRADRLLRYNVHYFDDLCALDAPARSGSQCVLVQRWIDENPPATGTGWEPYPVSLRVVNWIKWFLDGMSVEHAWRQSLAIQVRWLCARLEWHLMGNHLFANAKALVFAGAWYSDPEADRWLRQGLEILDAEVHEQILSDGGQFERSPMYHALAFEDMLDLINLAQTAGAALPDLAVRAPAWRGIASDMLHWLRCMSHPDGSLALFNDCADGIAPSWEELERYAKELGIEAALPPAEGVTELQPSGYIRMARGPALAMLDVAPIGPDYLPGHAHADTLSFELTIHGQRVIVNGGTSRYGLGAERHAERGTARHSTVQVAGADSSEVWGGFRVGRRARVHSLKLARWQVEASHDGYRYLSGSPTHRRSWAFEANELRVEDTLSPNTWPAVARYILAPGLNLDHTGDGHWRVAGPAGAIVRIEVLRGSARAADSMQSSEFGRQRQTRCLEVELVGGSAVTRWIW